MLITREQIIKKLADRCGFYMRDIRYVLSELDDLVEEELCQVNEDNDVVSIQLIRGLKIQGKFVPERARRDPRTNEPIVCSPTIKVHGKVSETIKEIVQKAYEEGKSIEETK